MRPDRQPRHAFRKLNAGVDWFFWLVNIILPKNAKSLKALVVIDFVGFSTCFPALPGTTVTALSGVGEIFLIVTKIGPVYGVFGSACCLSHLDTVLCLKRPSRPKERL